LDWIQNSKEKRRIPGLNFEANAIPIINHISHQQSSVTSETSNKIHTLLHIIHVTVSPKLRVIALIRFNSYLYFPTCGSLYLCTPTISLLKTMKIDFIKYTYTSLCWSGQITPFPNSTSSVSTVLL
jgi:hypothetical protein